MWNVWSEGRGGEGRGVEREWRVDREGKEGREVCGGRGVSGVEREQRKGEGREWRRGEESEAHSHFDQGNQCDCVGQ